MAVALDSIKFENGKVRIYSSLNPSIYEETSVSFNPVPVSTIASMTDTTKVYLYTGSETGYTAGKLYYKSGSTIYEIGTYQSSVPAISTTFTSSDSGKAADAKAVGDEFSDLKSALNNIDEGIGTRLALISTINGAYLNANGAVVTGQTSQFVVKKYKIKYGDVARLYGKSVRLAAALPLVCFHDENESSTTIINGTTTATDYDQTYTAAEDGYIYVAIVTTQNELIPYYDDLFDPLSIVKIKERLTTDEDQILTNKTSIEGLKNTYDQNIGGWYLTSSFINERYPFIQIPTSGEAINLYVKLIEPVNPNSIYINASNDNWSTQTQVFNNYGIENEFIAEIPSGYTSLRITASLASATSGNISFIIHEVDDHTLSQAVLDLQTDVKTIENKFASTVYVPNEVMTGTKNDGFYLNTNPYQGIRSISNTSFYVVAYAVEKGKAYYLIGKQVAINASLPIACYGVAVVADKNNYVEKILDGSATAQDFLQRYVAPDDGYIYIAGYSGKNELKLYNSQPIADAYIDDDSINEKLNIKIQLFGDSITDNQWGDESTWANYIQDNLRDYNVTVYNDAVGGSGIGHGKSTTTGSHQTDDYNYVYDLVTDGTTLHTDANYIVILVGTNNWTSGTALGDMSSTGYSTIYGALKGIIEYISSHSSATVFVCTIPQRYNSADQSKDTNANGEPINSNGVSLAEYCEAFREVSAFYGMPCIHLNEALGWNRINISNFCGDGLHPNAKGDKMLSAFICAEIEKHIGNVAY